MDESKKDVAAGSVVAKTGAAAARDIFKAKAATGQDKKKEGDVLLTSHSNAITCLCNAGSVGATLESLSTSSLDGRLVLWQLNSLSTSVAALKI